MVTLFPDRRAVFPHRLYPRDWLNTHANWSVCWYYFTRLEEAQRFGVEWRSRHDFSVMVFGCVIWFYRRKVCKVSPHR